jgi:hypothetical protein
MKIGMSIKFRKPFEGARDDRPRDPTSLGEAFVPSFLPYINTQGFILFS